MNSSNPRLIKNQNPKALLSKYGLRAKKKYSQNFLTSNHVIEKICHAFCVLEPEFAIELGPGMGALTQRLLQEDFKLLGIEKDPKMLEILTAEFSQSPNLSLILEDASHVNFEELHSIHKKRISVIGNLPYAVTGPILRNLTTHYSVIDQAVLMVQKEVAERLLSDPGKKTYGALSVFVNAVFETQLVVHVPPDCFHPAPKVFSSVVKLVPRENPTKIDSVHFQTVVHCAFEYRRKKFRNALIHKISDPVLVDKALSLAQIDGDRRGETFRIDEFHQLATAMDQLTINELNNSLK